ncbi:MAG: YkgJ family cysteine cluster protein [Arcobacteraceae bacterium]|jgi:uncharacterized protein|nr:YkgJ family cysteine cluster protein [Arcobacteraceae bacterium]MDY0328497.1 YkgJ family cysteine cluster protein [Arcobacteraceae bacterium]
MIQKDGFSFCFDEHECSKCSGNCCIGESGYIWISPKEMEEFAKFLDMSVEEFAQKYLIKVGYKYSIKEVEYQPNKFACVFFNFEQRNCGAYEVRPTQCRTFPFWDYFKDKVQEVVKECPAIKI